jgi:hypothetical protein
VPAIAVFGIAILTFAIQILMSLRCRFSASGFVRPSRWWHYCLCTWLTGGSLLALLRRSFEARNEICRIVLSKKPDYEMNEKVAALLSPLKTIRRTRS